MTRFLEDPLPAILLGLGVLSVLVVAYLQTRRRDVFVAIVAVVMLTILAVVAERVLVTEKEKIEATIYGIAAAAEANDMRAVLAHLAPGASRIRRLVTRYMPDGEVERARVLGSLKITIDETESPPTARAHFNGFVRGRWGSDQISGAQRADVETLLERSGDTWLIIEMEGINDR